MHLKPLDFTLNLLNFFRIYKRAKNESEKENFYGKKNKMRKILC